MSASYASSGKRHDSPILWGAQGSFFTGKARSYLIKKGIPYREIFISDPRFGREILPKIGHFAIPVVELCDGTLIQDTTDIILHFEAQVAEPRLLPATPVQNALAWILGCFGSESMWKLGLHYRWSYLEKQRSFVEAEFGRSLSREPNTAARTAQAAPVMEKFNGKLLELGVTPETIPAMEASFDELLDCLNEHFFHYPYLLGGRPTLADFGLIAPFYAHLARDPYPSTHMKSRAPNAFRWTERMFQTGFADAEFPDIETEFLSGDEIPQTLSPILEYFFREFGAEFSGMIGSYNQWCETHSDAAPGTLVQDPNEAGTSHPSLSWFEFEHRGVRNRRRDSVDIVYHLQRVFDVLDRLQGPAGSQLEELVTKLGGDRLMATRPRRRIAYEHYRYVFA